MQLLLDTHALIWWWASDSRLPEHVRTIMASRESRVHVSAASALEIAIKVRIGQLPEMADRITSFDIGVEEEGFQHLPVLSVHGLRAGLLPGQHRDPFDRLIAAQALIEGLTVVSRDREIAGFGCRTIW